LILAGLVILALVLIAKGKSGAGAGDGDNPGYDPGTGDDGDTQPNVNPPNATHVLGGGKAKGPVFMPDGLAGGPPWLAETCWPGDKFADLDSFYRWRNAIVEDCAKLIGYAKASSGVIMCLARLWQTAG
jgi:hypothetical protein